MIYKVCDDKFGFRCMNSIEVETEPELIEMFSFTKGVCGKKYPRSTCKKCVARKAREKKNSGDAYSSGSSGSYEGSDYPGGKT